MTSWVFSTSQGLQFYNSQELHTSHMWNNIAVISTVELEHVFLLHPICFSMKIIFIYLNI